MVKSTLRDAISLMSFGLHFQRSVQFVVCDRSMFKEISSLLLGENPLAKFIEHTNTIVDPQKGSRIVLRSPANLLNSIVCMEVSAIYIGLTESSLSDPIKASLDVIRSRTKNVVYF